MKILDEKQKDLKELCLKEQTPQPQTPKIFESLKFTHIPPTQIMKFILPRLLKEGTEVYSSQMNETTRLCELPMGFRKILPIQLRLQARCHQDDLENHRQIEV